MSMGGCFPHYRWLLRGSILSRPDNCLPQKPCRAMIVCHVGMVACIRCKSA